MQEEPCAEQYRGPLCGRMQQKLLWQSTIHGFLLWNKAPFVAGCKKTPCVVDDQGTPYVAKFKENFSLAEYNGLPLVAEYRRVPSEA
eukprot:2152213-Pyramimonas_sp.AAC.1